MNQENPLSALLDSVYELEGLVHIALNRDNPPAVLASLIERKALAIASLASEAVASIPAESSDEMQVYAEAPATPDEADPAEDEVIPLETVSPDYELGAEYSGSSEFSSYVREDEPLDGEDEAIGGEDELLGGEDEVLMGEDDAPSEEVETSPAVTAKPERVKGRGKPVFSLNDRYRFRRTLFNGSDTEYQGALSVLAGLDSYTEAEAYFYDTLGWLPEDEEVRDFMALLENWYK